MMLTKRPNLSILPTYLSFAFAGFIFRVINLGQSSFVVLGAGLGHKGEGYIAPLEMPSPPLAGGERGEGAPPPQSSPVEGEDVIGAMRRVDL